MDVSDMPRGNRHLSDRPVKNASWPYFLFHRRWVYAAQLGGVVLGIFGVLAAIIPSAPKWLTSTVWGWKVLMVVFVVTVWGTIVGFRREESLEAADRQNADLEGRNDALGAENDALKAENEMLNAELTRARDDNRALFEDVLKHLANGLGFADDERVTVYEFGEDGFASIGRYSRNMRLRGPGRRRCPVDEGVIGLAWNGKHAFVNDLPDPAKYPDRYCAEVERRCRIPASTVSKFKMKSRTLYAHRILDALGDGPVAVIVFESVRAAAFDPEAIQDAVQRDENRLKSYLAQRRTAMRLVDMERPAHG